MRKTIAAAMLCALVALGAPEASHAFCARYAKRTSARAKQTIQNERFVVLGVISSIVPKDSHGKFTFVLNVKRAFFGKPPARMEITDYGDFSFATDPKAAGSAAKASSAFGKTYGGQQAVVSVAPEDGVYKGRFMTSNCKYNAYGNAAAASFLADLHALFDAKPAPTPSKVPVVVKPSVEPAPAPVAARGAPPSRLGAILRAAALLTLVGGAIGFFGRRRPSGRTA